MFSIRVADIITQFTGQPATPVTWIQLGSETTQKYTFGCQGRTYFLRFFLPSITAADAKREIENHCFAAEKNLAPIVYAHGDDFIIMEELSAEILGSHDYESSGLAPLAKSLRMLHTTPIDQPLKKGIDIFTRTEKYLQQESMRAFADNGQLIKKYESYKNKLGETPLKDCLVHHDLHHANILKEARKIYFIDWHFSGLGNFYEDLAEVAIYLNAEERRHFLALYFQRNPHADESQQLQWHCELRALFFALWGFEQWQCLNPNRAFPYSCMNKQGENSTLSTYLRDLIMKSYDLKTNSSELERFISYTLNYECTADTH